VPPVQLYHFSDNPEVRVFVPRPVTSPVTRPPGQEWLNGLLVWAIDEPHGILYLFPRECPRIVIWPLPQSSDEDRRRWLGATTARAVAYLENRWLDRLRATTIWRYEMPTENFEDVGDVGMWVSREAVRPKGLPALTGLYRHLSSADVELRGIDELTPLRSVWNSSLHASGIRPRNAMNWERP
jgi:hypothetical protein